MSNEPDEPDEPSFHPSPLLNYQSDDSDLAPGCDGVEGAGFDLDAMETTEPKPSPGAFGAPPSSSSASLAASLHLPEDQLTPCKSPVAQAGAQPARPPSRPSPRPTKHISDGLQDPPTRFTQLRNPTAPPDLAQPKHVGADGPSGSAITHLELALTDAQVIITATSTSLEHPNTRALQQLQDDKWLGDEAMEKIMGQLRTADVAIFEVASPPTHDWHAWAQSHRLKLLPSQATVLIPLY
ncbi:hypothetical protein SLS56_011483 [Neofusicoccum ribis]|uniref:Uncharacterized protein n=1 Tax=Neofusicoccum ribis TaxID=45134 RepID=A0ABR3SBJ8_9PEZI